MAEANGKQPIVEIKDVVKKFRVGSGEVTILKGVSFQVKPGEFLSIVGPSGNGKSTMLNMITGIDRPSSGEIVVTGQRVDRMSEDRLAAWRGENVGIIFQFFQMLPALSLLQNVVLPMDLARKYKPRGEFIPPSQMRHLQHGSGLRPSNRSLARRVMEPVKAFQLLKGYLRLTASNLILLKEFLVVLSQLVTDFVGGTSTNDSRSAIIRTMTVIL